MKHESSRLHDRDSTRQKYSEGVDDLTVGISRRTDSLWSYRWDHLGVNESFDVYARKMLSMRDTPVRLASGPEGSQEFPDLQLEYQL
jgi:hypothetical protein